jgi:hypothetical protein
MQKLTYRLQFRIYLQTVLGKFPRNTRHVSRLPCKDIPILTEEFDERVFLFSHMSPHAELFERITRNAINKLGVLS